MTELEALAKDCIENHTHKLIDRPSKQDIYIREESIYISGYKECERQNKNKIAELESQIEKMKCCANCNHYRWSNGEDWCDDHYGQPMYDEECKDKWELRR